MRKFPVLALLSLSSLLIVSMQNCGSFQAGSGQMGQPFPADSLGSSRAESLSCNQAGALQTGAPIVTREEQIKAYGRLSHDQTKIGFLTKDGRAYYGYADGQIMELDPGSRYAWMYFDVGQSCGITLAGRVRCNERNKSNWIEIPELSGSQQVITFSNGPICGLDASGAVKCLENGQLNTLNLPEPILLMTEYEFYGRNSLRRYWSSHALKGEIVDWTYGSSIFERRTKATSYSDAEVNFCGLEVASSSFPEFDNYTSDRGCVLTSRGVLICMDTIVGPDKKPRHVSLKADGQYTRELASLSQGRRYLWTERTAGGRIACAVRDDLETVCFNTGFHQPHIALERAFAIQPIERDLVRIANAETVTDAAANPYKSCVIQNGEATCWRTPMIEMDGTVHQPYKIQTKQLQSIAGFMNNNEADRTYGRACFLDVSGHLLCEPLGAAKSVSGEVVDQDPGILWKRFKFEVSQPSISCGLTAAGHIRCTKEYSGTNANVTFETMRTDAVADSDGYYLLSNGTFIDESGLRSNRAPSPSGVQYASDVAGHPGLYVATNGRRYMTSYQGAVEIPQASFDRIKDLKNTSTGHYFERATNMCVYFSFGTIGERRCVAYAPTNVDADASYAFVSIANGVWIQDNGKVASMYGGSSELHFMPPTVMTPVQ